MGPDHERSLKSFRHHLVDSTVAQADHPFLPLSRAVFVAMADNPVWKAAKPFATGSLAGMFATCCIQPIDMVKVRIQLTAGTAEAAGPVLLGPKDASRPCRSGQNGS